MPQDKPQNRLLHRMRWSIVDMHTGMHFVLWSAMQGRKTDMEGRGAEPLLVSFAVAFIRCLQNAGSTQCSIEDGATSWTEAACGAFEKYRSSFQFKTWQPFSRIRFLASTTQCGERRESHWLLLMSADDIMQLTVCAMKIRTPKYIAAWSICILRHVYCFNWLQSDRSEVSKYEEQPRIEYECKRRNMSIGANQVNWLWCAHNVMAHASAHKTVYTIHFNESISINSRHIGWNSVCRYGKSQKNRTLSGAIVQMHRGNRCGSRQKVDNGGRLCSGNVLYFGRFSILSIFPIESAITPTLHLKCASHRARWGGRLGRRGVSWRRRDPIAYQLPNARVDTNVGRTQCSLDAPFILSN